MHPGYFTQFLTSIHQNDNKCWKPLITFLFGSQAQNSWNTHFDVYQQTSSITNNLIILAVFFIDKWKKHGKKSSSSSFILFPNQFDKFAELFFLLLSDLSKGIYSVTDDSLCLVMSLTNNSQTNGDVKYFNVDD